MTTGTTASSRARVSRVFKEAKEIKEEARGNNNNNNNNKSLQTSKGKDSVPKKENEDDPQKSPVVNTKREVYYTPDYAFDIIAPVIRDFKSIWDPAAGSEKFPVRTFFEKIGHRVITTDILESPECDFLLNKTKKRFDMIVTTPPYSLRKEFIQRACDLKKPFALLVPVNVLESRTVRDLLKQQKISVIYPAKTVVFSSPTDSRSVRTLPYSIWLVHGVERLPAVVYQ
jgi:hypothetical protein